MIKILKYLKKSVFFVAFCGFLTMSVQAPVMAGMIGTQDIAAAAEMDNKREDVRSFTARADVSQALLDLGVDANDIEQRINGMTDAEILELHENIDNLPAGQSVLGTIIGLLVIFMLLDVAGVTDIFPGI